MIYGLLDFTFWQYVIATLALTHLTIIGVTLFLHRSQTHRAVEFHPVINHILRFWLWMTTGMVTKEWVAVHRKHHANCEEEADPHSPKQVGINRVLWFGAFLYHSEITHHPDILERYGQGTPNDWIENHIYTPYHYVGIIILFIAYCLLFGLPGVLMWLIQMAWIPFWAAGVINGIGHYWGYRDFETPDASTNIVPWGIIIGGEELHNNHHAFSASAKFSIRPWEFDIGWLYISVLRFFKLARVKHLVPDAMHADPSKLHADRDTLRALLTYRFSIMKRYRDLVLWPVFSEEKRHSAKASRKLFKRRTFRLVAREISLIDSKEKTRLNTLFETAHRLKTVYTFRLNLQKIWEKTRTDRKDLLPALQEWCKQAEATGIETLKRFAEQLKTYSISSSS